MRPVESPWASMLRIVSGRFIGGIGSIVSFAVDGATSSQLRAPPL